MSQTTFPFWYWAEPGAFYGTPYRNYAGWFGTSALFMSVAALLWGNIPLKLERSHLNIPLVVYLSNIAFAAGISLAGGYWLPVLLALLVGVIPVLILWWMAQPRGANAAVAEATNITELPVEVALK